VLCVLCVLDGVLAAAPRLAAAPGLADVAADLMQLINHHRFTPVMAGATRCLGALARRQPAAAGRLGQMAGVYWSWLKAPGAHAPAHLPRFLFIMGQLCRRALPREIHVHTSWGGRLLGHIYFCCCRWARTAGVGPGWRAAARAPRRAPAARHAPRAFAALLFIPSIQSSFF
jgi:hypothetical protein